MCLLVAALLAATLPVALALFERQAGVLLRTVERGLLGGRRGCHGLGTVGRDVGVDASLVRGCDGRVAKRTSIFTFAKNLSVVVVGRAAHTVETLVVTAGIGRALGLDRTGVEL